MPIRYRTIVSWLRAVPGALIFAIAVAVMPANAAEEVVSAEQELAAGAEDQAADEEGSQEEVPATDATVGGQMGEVSLEKFIPTEEISADGAVSFPVDI